MWWLDRALSWLLNTMPNTCGKETNTVLKRKTKTVIRKYQRTETDGQRLSWVKSFQKCALSIMSLECQSCTCPLPMLLFISHLIRSQLLSWKTSLWGDTTMLGVLLVLLGISPLALGNHFYESHKTTINLWPQGIPRAPMDKPSSPRGSACPVRRKTDLGLTNAKMGMLTPSAQRRVSPTQP